MKELESLLNSLIGRGWHPFWKEALNVEIDDNVISISREDFFEDETDVSIRDITSLDSGLWQFVCDNKLYNRTYNFRENVRKNWYNIWWFGHNFQYWILESALIPEEELVQFLIDNIII